MRFSTVAVLLASAAAVTAQNTINVIVGANDTLTYSPPSVNASVGDTIAFTLYVYFLSNKTLSDLPHPFVACRRTMSVLFVDDHISMQTWVPSRL
jgi:hypothetical protein